MKFSNGEDPLSFPRSPLSFSLFLSLSLFHSLFPSPFLSFLFSPSFHVWRLCQSGGWQDVNLNSSEVNLDFRKKTDRNSSKGKKRKWNVLITYGVIPPNSFFFFFGINVLPSVLVLHMPVNQALGCYWKLRTWVRSTVLGLTTVA